MMTEMQTELRTVRELTQDQGKLLQLLEKRSNRMPRTFVIIPDRGSDVPPLPSNATTLQKMSSYLTRQKEKVLDLVWER